MSDKNINSQPVHDIVADVHKPVNNGFRVKASIYDLGVYINGMLVFPPHDEYKEWSVIPPSKRAGPGKWANIIEFDKSTPLWAELHDACLGAVEKYTSGDKLRPPLPKRKPSNVEHIFDDELSTPVDLSDIPW